MTRWPLELFLLLLVGESTAASCSSPFFDAKYQLQQNHNRTCLTVGYLTTTKGELKDKQGLAISGALTMALDEVGLSF